MMLVAGTLIHMNSFCHEDLCCEFEVNGSVSENFVNPKVFVLNLFIKLQIN